MTFYEGDRVALEAGGEMDAHELMRRAAAQIASALVDETEWLLAEVGDGDDLLEDDLEPY